MLTGPFYPKADDVTYTITFDDYGTQAEHHGPVSARRPGRAAPRLLLALAAVAVAFAAADTYVVVLALPDMMLSVGLASTSSSGPRRSSPASCSATSRCCR